MENLGSISEELDRLLPIFQRTVKMFDPLLYAVPLTFLSRRPEAVLDSSGGFDMAGIVRELVWEFENIFDMEDAESPFKEWATGWLRRREELESSDLSASVWDQVRIEARQLMTEYRLQPARIIG